MKATVTGISGQDGFFLSKLLSEKNYDIIGVVRRNSSMTTGTMEKLPPRVKDRVWLSHRCGFFCTIA